MAGVLIEKSNMLLNIVLCLCFSIVMCHYLDLPEGSPCTWEGVQGRCVSAHRCFATIQDIESEQHTPVCTYQEENPIICCTDCDLVNDTRLILINPSLGALYKTGDRKAKDKCIDYIHSLDFSCKHNSQTTILKKLNAQKNCYEYVSETKHGHFAVYGGRNAGRQEFPHMALLGYGESMDTASWLCGGTVISERFILTAAHCGYTTSVGPVNYVALGILQRSDPTTRWQRHHVKRIIPHPEYQPPSKYHDIALLETDMDITFSPDVHPACLHTVDQNDEGAQATGWGTLGYKKELADVLQAVYIRKFSEKECSEYYPPHRHFVNGLNYSTQSCYGDRLQPRDTCMGDSGSPLQIQSQDGCVYVILGITSFGRQCGIVGSPGVYTRVRYYVPWMESIVWP